VSAAPTQAPTMVDAQVTPAEACPLCGAPLRADQDWCVRCGAAARTRLAAPAKWKALATTLVIVVALSLAVLIVALVKLSG
jgi:predicted nucleic acid-binding Zn ribbon protein